MVPGAHWSASAAESVSPGPTEKLCLENQCLIVTSGLHIHMYMHAPAYICIHIAHTYASLHIQCVYTCVYIYMCTYTYTYTRVFRYFLFLECCGSAAKSSILHMLDKLPITQPPCLLLSVITLDQWSTRAHNSQLGRCFSGLLRMSQ